MTSIINIKGIALAFFNNAEIIKIHQLPCLQFGQCMDVLIIIMRPNKKKIRV